MNRRLVVLRHAKSARDSDALTDHGRPLNKRGRRDAPRVGRALRERGWVPEVVMSSDSRRTQQTWAGVARELGHDAEIRFTRALYHSGIGPVRRLLAGLPDEVEVALVLGHNPGWEALVGFLSGDEVTLKTADAALLEGDGSSWSALLQEPGTMHLAEVVRARDL